MQASFSGSNVHDANANQVPLVPDREIERITNRTGIHGYGLLEEMKVEEGAPYHQALVANAMMSNEARVQLGQGVPPLNFDSLNNAFGERHQLEAVMEEPPQPDA